MSFFRDMSLLFTRYHSFFYEGIRNTLIISAFSVLIAIVLGTLLAMLRMSRLLPLRLVATAYIEFIRGTPLMVQLMFIFYGLPMIGVSFPDIPFIPDFSRFTAGIVAMSMNSCAYVAEIIRSGIQAVDIGQTEAARSLGLSQRQTMTEIILPQAIKNILPALGNEFIMILKDTSLASTFFIGDLMTQCLLIKGTTYLTMEPLIMVAVVYFVLTFILTKLLAVFERRLRRGDIR